MHTLTLTDDHLDLLVTAATDWHLLASPTMAAFAGSPLEQHIVVASATETGRVLRAENMASVQWLSDRGRTRLSERGPSGPYTHHRVENPDPVEVIKAARQLGHALELRLPVAQCAGDLLRCLRVVPEVRHPGLL